MILEMVRLRYDRLLFSIQRSAVKKHGVVPSGDNLLESKTAGFTLTEHPEIQHRSLSRLLVSRNEQSNRARSLALRVP